MRRPASRPRTPRGRPPALRAAACLLGCAALLAGCGGSGGSGTSGKTAPAHSSSSAGVLAGASPQVQAGLRECLKLVQQQHKLPAASRAKLETACTKAAEGDSAAVRKAAREVCEEVIGGSGLGNGPARQAALAACRK